MSSPQSTVTAVHSPAPMQNFSLGFCPGCGGKAPKGGYKLSMKCAECGHVMRAKDARSDKHLSEAFRVTLGETSTDGARRSWIMYMPLGKFYHPQYGELNFTRKLLDEVKCHFDNRDRGIEIALDEDHSSGRDITKAAGWMEDLEFHEAQGEKLAGLYTLVRWTPIGVYDIENELYKYFSPEYGNHLNELTGDTIPNVAFGGGLTNRPFLKVMPAVQLAEVSRKPWSSVDKSNLPRSCFLIQGDPNVKSTWKLPVYESNGKGGRGALNINGVKAALGAIHGARSGKNMTGVPAGTVAKLTRWLTQYGDGNKEMEEPMAKKLMGPTSRTADDEEAPQLAENQDDTMEYDDSDAMEYAEDDNEDLEDNGDDEEGEEEPTPPKKSAKKAVAKKMSEYAGMSNVQLAERLAFLEHERAVSLAERAVDSQLAAWQSGTFQFSETKGRNLPKVALSKVFTDAYHALMLSEEGMTLSEGTQRQVQKVIELALTRAIVPLGQVAKSGFDTPRTRNTQPRATHGDQEAHELALVNAAMELAEGDGKQWETLSFGDRANYQLKAERQVAYFAETH